MIKPFGTLLIFMSISFLAFGQERDTDRDIIAMRMIGHQLMLWEGNSTAAIPPIMVADDDSYRINLSTEFQFEPQKLVEFIAKVMQDYQVADNYRVQVRECQHDTIIYSYQVGGKASLDIIPCIGREQKKACYYLIVNILDVEADLLADNRSKTVTASNESLLIAKPYSIAILIILTFLGVWLLGRSRKANEVASLSKEASFAAVKKLGQTQFNRLDFSLTYNEQKTELSAKESDLLEFLAKHLNQRVEKDKILKAVWGDDGDYVGRTLDVFISKLRKKLAADNSIRIVNIRGIGYQLVVEAAA
jgi:hypothetical protein